MLALRLPAIDIEARSMRWPRRLGVRRASMPVKRFTSTSEDLEDLYLAEKRWSSFERIKARPIP
jgi:hypothetical protein